MNTSVATNSPAFVSNPLNPLQSDYGRASFDVRHAAVINATYDLPFGRKADMPDENRWWNAAIGNWQISGIETLVSGLPFTPQLSYNPSNDGDSRNPVRPSLNPAFTGSIIEGGPGQYFNPNAFIQPLAKHLRQRAAQFPAGPGTRDHRCFRGQKIPVHGTGQSPVPGRTVQYFQSHQFQQSESRRVYFSDNSAADGHRRRHHLHVHQFAPGAIWVKIAVVS